MADFTIKRNDTRPVIAAQLTQDGNPYDLTGATVKFLMKLPASGSPKVDASATIVNASNGDVEYAWIASDTDTEGEYDAEWEVTDGSGEVLTFPNGHDTAPDYISVEVVEDLG